MGRTSSFLVIGLDGWVRWQLIWRVTSIGYKVEIGRVMVGLCEADFTIRAYRQSINSK